MRRICEKDVPKVDLKIIPTIEYIINLKKRKIIDVKEKN